MLGHGSLGRFALGELPTLAPNIVLTAATGSYALTGKDVAFKWNHVLAVGAGSYALTGKDVTFAVSVPNPSMTAVRGTYTISGQDILWIVDDGAIDAHLRATPMAVYTMQAKVTSRRSAI